MRVLAILISFVFLSVCLVHKRAWAFQPNESRRTVTEHWNSTLLGVFNFDNVKIKKRGVEVFLNGPVFLKALSDSSNVLRALRFESDIQHPFTALVGENSWRGIWADLSLNTVATQGLGFSFVLGILKVSPIHIDLSKVKDGSGGSVVVSLSYGNKVKIPLTLSRTQNGTWVLIKQNGSINESSVVEISVSSVDAELLARADEKLKSIWDQSVVKETFGYTAQFDMSLKENHEKYIKDGIAPFLY